MDKYSINIKKIVFFAALLVLSIVFIEQIKDCIAFYNINLKFYFTENISQLKIYYPNFYWIIFLFTRFIKYIIPLSLLTILFRNRKKLTYHLMKNLSHKLILLFISIFISIIVIEGILRLTGFKPGKISYSQWVKSVDNLEYLKGFSTDSLGIFKVDTQYLNLFELEKDYSYFYTNNLFKNNYVNEIFSLIDEYNKDECDNAFSKKITKVKETIITDVDSAIINYSKVPINKDGFHSIEFKQYKSTKKKILLLGDSFTWGHSTSNKTNSFANELLAKGYIVYNTGISGVDVTQYKAIAEKYIPILKPDIVILNFFMGNDISYFKREIKPFQPVFFSTNAGNLMSNQNGIEFKTAQEAYNNIMINAKMPINTKIRRIASKTVISTFAWVACRKLGLVDYYKTTNRLIGKAYEKPTCNEEIQKIVSLSKKNNSHFELIAIPDFKDGKIKVEDFPYLFENIDYRMSPLSKEFYKMSDGHFNDKGHKEYADFLDELIHQTFSKSDSIN